MGGMDVCCVWCMGMVYCVVCCGVGVVWWMEVFPLFLLSAQVEREGRIESVVNGIRRVDYCVA